MFADSGLQSETKRVLSIAEHARVGLLSSESARCSCRQLHTSASLTLFASMRRGETRRPRALGAGQRRRVRFGRRVRARDIGALVLACVLSACAVVVAARFCELWASAWCTGVWNGARTFVDHAVLALSRTHSFSLDCHNATISVLRWQAYARADLDVVSAANLAAIDQEAASNVRCLRCRRRLCHVVSVVDGVMSPMSKMLCMSCMP